MASSNSKRKKKLQRQKEDHKRNTLKFQLLSKLRKEKNNGGLNDYNRNPYNADKQNDGF